MTSLSQQNLLNLAQKSEANGDFEQAIQYLEEALRSGRTAELVIRLCDLYLKNGQEYAAFALIKEEPDLFSEQDIFAEYSKILQANHFLIEALEVQNLSKKSVQIAVSPIPLAKQQEVMRQFRQKNHVTQFDYEQLFKLDLSNFVNFAQSLLLDPSLNFAVRIALCEDLVRLGVKDKIRVLVLGQSEDFIPQDTELLEKGTVYREIISAIGSRYYHRPSQLPTVLGEVNLILGSLYPKLAKYVDEPDSFASDLASYIEKHDGRGHHKLFEQIYANLPK
ncbi:tetratricopeptide repeat protein [Lactobacillus sp. ESL0731]|uniref:tetratricopeptide repeat protein n=1 Tax=unclassified Lactobacillus TaxID=2620435 RepID=UPI0023F89538|nr:MULTISPECIES: tetratricopeptide repeat protein [unclassified Lactobacillus]WEV51960.1 tetratricopeptide repeat protein [Lactobacillus sp. ESL0700]WEV63091.1 tetratricopeptide repeat protein [Lactobacillus sp. ESL0731]